MDVTLPRSSFALDSGRLSELGVELALCASDPTEFERDGAKMIWDWSAKLSATVRVGTDLLKGRLLEDCRELTEAKLSNPILRDRRTYPDRIAFPLRRGRRIGECRTAGYECNDTQCDQSLEQSHAVPALVQAARSRSWPGLEIVRRRT